MSSLTYVRLAIIATYFFAFFAAFFVLLFGATFTRGQRSRYRMLGWLDGKQVNLATAATLCMLVSYVAYAWKDLLTINISMEMTSVPTGQTIEKGTLGTLRRELAHESDRRVRQAEEAFEAGELAFKAERYAEAARQYNTSVDSLPSMSGFLNAGISLWHIADFIGAKSALTEGLALARQNKDEAFQAAYLNGFGLIAGENGDDAQAEEAFTELLRLHGAGRPAIRANVLNNLGVVYTDQKRLSDALTVLTSARDLFISINNREGEAKTLANIAVLQGMMGDPAKEMKLLDAAYQIFEAEGNRFGVAQCKQSMAGAYYEQENYLACVEMAAGALSLSETVDDARGKARTLHTLGLCRLKLGHRKEALEAFEDAFNLYAFMGLLDQDARNVVGDLHELEAAMRTEHEEAQ